MLISFEYTLAQTIGVIGVTLPSKGPMRDQYVLLQNLKVFTVFSPINISGDSVSFFIQMIMLISLEYTLAHTRMVFGRVNIPSKGPMRGKYIFLIAKSQTFFFIL